MQGTSFIVKYLFAFGCLFSLSSFAQTAGAQDTLKPVVADSLSKTVATVQKNPKQVDDIIAFAKTFLGTPYRYAGSTPSGPGWPGVISGCASASSRREPGVQTRARPSIDSNSG